VALLGAMFVRPVDAQFLYMDYPSGHDNVYYQKEAHMADRYYRETVMGDTLIDNLSWTKVRTCTMAQPSDSCYSTRTAFSFIRFSDVSVNGIPASQQFVLTAFGDIDTSRVFSDDTIIAEGLDSVYLRREVTCQIDSQAYSFCYHIYSVSDTESFHMYFVKGIGLVKKEQIRNSADASQSYYYLRKLVRSAPTGTRRRGILAPIHNRGRYRIDGRAGYVPNAVSVFGKFYLVE